MSFVGSSILCAAFFYFSIVFPKERRDITHFRLFLNFTYLISLIFVIFSFAQLMVRGAQWETLTFQYGVAHKYFGVYLVVIYVLGGTIFSQDRYKIRLD